MVHNRNETQSITFKNEGLIMIEREYEDMTINSLLPDISLVNLIIRSDSAYSQYYNDFGFVGNLTTLKAGFNYEVRGIVNEFTVDVSGIPINIDINSIETKINELQTQRYYPTSMNEYIINEANGYNYGLSLPDNFNLEFLTTYDINITNNSHNEAIILNNTIDTTKTIDISINLLGLTKDDITLDIDSSDNVYNIVSEIVDNTNIRFTIDVSSVSYTHLTLPTNA